MENMKSCAMCFQQIDARARKCPFCHHWQNKVQAILFHPAIAVLPFALVFIIGPFLLKNIFDPGKSFDPYKNQVKIIGSQLTFGQSDCGPTLVVMGTFKNDSDVTWKDLQLEARFFDQDGKLIDTGQKNEYSFVLQAKSEAPFKLSMKREFPGEIYASHLVRILTARDAKAPF